MADFEPVKIDSSKVVEEERETLFWIDDREFTIPARIKPNIVMGYFADIRDPAVGPTVALANAMAAVLGDDAIEALAECDAVGEEEMEQIMAIVEKKLMGARAAGKSRSARRK